MTKISIIIPTFNRNKILEQTLSTVVKAIQNISAEIIVVNDSKNNDVTIKSELLNKFILLNNPGSGVASARNFGAKNATGNLLLFIDDDILISSENIQRTIELHKLHPDDCFNFNWKYPESLLKELEETQFGRFLMNVKLIDYKGWVHHPNWNDNEIFEVSKLAAFFFVIPKNIFINAEGFNESFKNQSVEDDEFSARLVKSGVRLFIDPKHYVLHNESDKINLEARLKRLKTGAHNQRQAYDMGMKEYFIPYSLIKIVSYSVLSKIKTVLLLFCHLIPNLTVFDFFYRWLAHLLIGVVIFEGYYLKKNA